jgi:Tol biopolymer transport system component
MRLEISMPGLVGNAVIPSPDGQRLAFVNQSPEGMRSIWVRPIGSDKAQQIPGTENVNGVIWSGDSRYLAFVVAGKLKKIDPSGGGSAQQIADVAGNRGISWSKNGVILFARSDNAIVRVSDSGGEVKPVLQPDASRKEVLLALPVFLPDDNHFVYAAVSGLPDKTGFYVSSLDGKTPPKQLIASTLLRTNGFAYGEPGYLLYAVDGKLTAHRFDASALKVQGDPFTISDDIEGGFTVTNTGLLTFRRAATAESNKQLQWFDRDGRRLEPVGAPANYGGIDLSPNGDRVAVDIVSNNNKDIWVIDLARAVPSRITFDPATDWSTQWSPDGNQLIFASAGRNREGGGATQIYRKASSGVGTEEVVPTDGNASIPVHWSPDNKYIVFSRTKQNGNDTWILPLFGDKKPKPLLESPFDKIQAQVSPDGRWIAYVTNETGAFQIVVQSFPDPNGGKWQISADGGVEPKWRHDGRELYYLALDGKLMSVSIKTDRTLEAGRPAALFQTPLTVNRTRPDRDRHYDPTHDGQKFLLVTPESRQITPVTVLVNWPAMFEGNRGQ